MGKYTEQLAHALLDVNILAKVQVGTPVKLLPEPENPTNPRAIKALVDGIKIGNIAPYSWLFKFMLDDKIPVASRVHEILGGTESQPLTQIVLEVRTGDDAIQALSGSAGTSKSPLLPYPSPARERAGCMGFLFPGAVARQAAIEEAARVRGLRRAEALAAMEAYKEKMKHEDWAFNECKFLNSTAFLAVKRDHSAFRIVQYEHGEQFVVNRVVDLKPTDIISARINDTEKVESYMRTELVPVAINNKKSPITRGIVGGVLLGPVGAVVGSASGLGGKSQVVTEERKVQDSRVVKGIPELVIGCANDLGVITIKFHGETHAEHWLNQIRSARAKLRLPPLY